jgi:hypothetical protein
MVRAEPAFREHASGLIVPADISREREIWTKAEWKALDKVTAFLASKRIAVFLGCEHDDCKADRRLERVRRPDGGVTLQCGHKERHVIPGI